jgi:O-antigen ligase
VSQLRAFERRPASLVPFVVISSIGLVLLDLAIELKQTAFALLGRDPTLTNRTELWDLLRGMAVDPLLGAGFMSFWSGERMDHVWQKLGAGINQAHSGYLEQYLNLGYVGLAFLAAIIVSALQSIRRQLRRDQSGAILRFCFVATAILYNYTEASFYGMNNMWILFLLGCFDMSRQPAARQAEEPRVVSGEKEQKRQGHTMLQPLSESGRR